MIRRAAGKVMWVGWASRAPLYAQGVVMAVMVVLLIGVLAVRPAHAATFTVDTTDDPTLGLIPVGCTSAPNDCSLRAGIELANSNAETDTINFASGLNGTITLATGQLSISNDAVGPDLSIVGPGGSGLTVSGNNASRVFQIASGAETTINRLTISDGAVSSTSYGAGIFNETGGTLTLRNSTVSGNAADHGGGIFNDGALTLTNNTVSANTAALSGGGIVSTGTLTLINSTVSDNHTGGPGGGLINFGTGTTKLRNTIVAGNTAGGLGPDAFFSGQPFTSEGHNLIGNTTDSSGFGGSDLLNVDPLLGPLQNNGGPTNTHALLSGSPAIDAGENMNCPSTDQRGVLRKDGDANGITVCDIGSFEAANTKPTITKVKPAPASKTRDRTPLIAATVRDAQTNLAKSDIKLFVDGHRKSTFSYNRSTERLSYISGRLSFGSHAVKIVATEGVQSTTKRWSFKVVS